ncbi:ankyrin repeat domain-containing protein [bacterium]|nr:ankyrin repeat domain-containing protein [bacterium]
MKHLLLTTIAAVLVVGCGEAQQSAPAPEAKPVEPVAGAKAPDISIHVAAREGNIEAVKQHLASGADVNVKGKYGRAPLHYAASNGRKEIAELLIANGADVNAKDENGRTALDWAHGETAALLRKHGGKRGRR